MKETKREIKIVSFSDSGDTCAIRMATGLIEIKENAEVFSGRSEKRLKTWLNKHYTANYVLVFVGSVNTAVHAIAPLMQDVPDGPPVLVSDEKGDHIIPILAGKNDDANTYAQKIAGLMGGRAIITVTSTQEPLPEFDQFIERNHLLVAEQRKAMEFATAFSRNKVAQIMMPEELKGGLMFSGKLPNEYELVAVTKAGVIRRTDTVREAEPTPRATACLISPFSGKYRVLHLIPRCFVLGVDYDEAADAETIEASVMKFLRKNRIHERALHTLAVKKGLAGADVVKRLSEKLEVPVHAVTPVKEEKKADDAPDGMQNLHLADRLVLGAEAVRVIASGMFPETVSASVGLTELILSA